MTAFLYPENCRPAPADNLFVVASAYHLILAHVLALDPEAAPGSSALLMKHQPVTAFPELYRAVKADPHVPFQDVYFLDRPGRKYKRRWRALIDKMRAAGMRRVAKGVGPKRLFIFNEDDLNQYAARILRRRGTEIIAVEDGAIAYIDQRMTASPGERFKSQLLFGPRTQAVEVEGASSNIDRFYARFPARVRPELRRHVVGLPSSDLSFFNTMAWPADYMQRLGATQRDLSADVLFMLAHRNNFKGHDNYADVIRHTVARHTADGDQVAVSYHPRERDADWLDLAALGAKLIPHAVPSELVYLYGRGSIKMVYGDIGTALITAKWVLPDTPAVSLMRSLEIKDDKLDTLFESLDIERR
ncbi:polysialyltransferase family glycosyltransferase [Salinisphaera hydrothermalis]|uniref:polysialyltransferase family glycosyltransferase n=1 Tax=Salinisphaera hydrothermalis TaxID=563188 RepID=UPI00333F34DE